MKDFTKRFPNVDAGWNLPEEAHPTIMGQTKAHVASVLARSGHDFRDWREPGGRASRCIRCWGMESQMSYQSIGRRENPADYVGEDGHYMTICRPKERPVYVPAPTRICPFCLGEGGEHRPPCNFEGAGLRLPD